MNVSPTRPRRPASPLRGSWTAWRWTSPTRSDLGPHTILGEDASAYVAALDVVIEDGDARSVLDQRERLRAALSE
ncbi:MAG: hypothetical protein M3063_03390 [Actinomycetota bacterium]|nr:hypothetical protein [Actinomycetota bacterium]